MKRPTFAGLVRRSARHFDRRVAARARRALKRGKIQSSELTVRGMVVDLQKGARSAIQVNTLCDACFVLGIRLFYAQLSADGGPSGTRVAIPELGAFVLRRRNVLRGFRGNPYTRSLRRLPFKVLAGVMGASDHTLRKVCRGDLKVGLLAHQQMAWCEHLVLWAESLYLRQPAPVRVQLPGDGFVSWVKELRVKQQLDGHGLLTPVNTKQRRHHA